MGWLRVGHEMSLCVAEDSARSMSIARSQHNWTRGDFSQQWGESLTSSFGVSIVRRSVFRKSCSSSVILCVRD